MQEGSYEISIYIERARRHFRDMRNSTTGQDLRKSWEYFLADFARAIGRLIDYSRNRPETKDWSKQLLDASKKNDEGLVFLREARNHVEHGIGPFAKFRDPSVGIGDNSFRFDSVSDMLIEDSYIGGTWVDRLSVSAAYGRVISAESSSPVPLNELPAEVILVPIYNKDKTFPVPKAIGGKVISDNTPEGLAAAALDEVDRLFKEFSGS